MLVSSSKWTASDLSITDKEPLAVLMILPDGQELVKADLVQLAARIGNIQWPSDCWKERSDGHVKYVISRGEISWAPDVFQCLLAMIHQWPTQELIEANQNPTLFLCPLLSLKFHTASLRAHRYSESFRIESMQRYSNADQANVDRYKTIWKPLRDEFEVTKRALRSSERYCASIPKTAGNLDLKLESLFDEANTMLADIEIFEQQLRDDLQLQVGQLSLLESQKSIMQSKISIEEGKRVKLSKSLTGHTRKTSKKILIRSSSHNTRIHFRTGQLGNFRLRHEYQGTKRQWPPNLGLRGNNPGDISIGFPCLGRCVPMEHVFKGTKDGQYL